MAREITRVVRPTSTTMEGPSVMTRAMLASQLSRRSVSAEMRPV
jgi:hypothetical protein